MDGTHGCYKIGGTGGAGRFMTACTLLQARDDRYPLFAIVRSEADWLLSAMPIQGAN